MNQSEKILVTGIFSFMIAHFLIGLLIAYVIFDQLNNPIIPEPPIVQWIDSQYEPGAFCPGDLVAEIVTVDASEAASILVTATFVRAGPSGDNAKTQRLGDARIANIPDARTIEDADIKWEVPDLPPGDYVRSIAAGTLFRNTEPIFRQQKFTVRDDCD